MSLNRIRKNSGLEAWVCHSTMSIYLYESWKTQTLQRGFFFLAPSSPLLDENCPLSAQVLIKKDRRKYRLKEILFLALSSIINGHRLQIRLPHLREPMCHRRLELLARLGIIRLALYDDGFLGIVETPTVCEYLQPIFESICSWNIQDWSLSEKTMRRLSKHCSISFTYLRLEDTAKDWRDRSTAVKANASVFIVEAKYMDYDLLNSLAKDRIYNTETPDESVPCYFEHPRYIKRNTKWPSNRERTISKEAPIEAYLSSVISRESHVITGMTSTAIILCDLVKKNVVPKHSLTLLLTSAHTGEDFHSLDELRSYVKFVKGMYSSTVNLEIFVDGGRVEIETS